MTIGGGCQPSIYLLQALPTTLEALNAYSEPEQEGYTAPILSVPRIGKRSRCLSSFKASLKALKTNAVPFVVLS